MGEIMDWIFALVFWLSVGLILYHLVGYPLLLFLLSRFIRRPVKRADFTPLISVIIPAYNEGGVIREKLHSVLNSHYPGECIEIIVPEDGSSDNTVEQVLSVADPRVILDSSPVRGGKMAALNRSIARARGDIFVFTDANAILHPDTLRNLMSNFADPQVGCVSGKKLVGGEDALGKNENLYWKYESWIKTAENMLGSPPAAVGELLAVRRELYAVPDKGIINDDFYLLLSVIRQGFRFVYDPSAFTIEKGSGSLPDEYHRKSRIAAGRWQQIGNVFSLTFKRPWFVFTFISHKLLRLLVFPLMVLAFLSNLGALIFNWDKPFEGLSSFLALHSPWVQIFFCAQVLFYLLAGIGAVLDRQGIRFKPLYFLYFFVNAQAAQMGGLVRFSSRRQTVLWKKAAR
jgi:poly-beta-1,6-N-acetyl-D-glucosamine synthase